MTHVTRSPHVCPLGKAIIKKKKERRNDAEKGRRLILSKVFHISVVFMTYLINVQCEIKKKGYEESVREDF